MYVTCQIEKHRMQGILIPHKHSDVHRDSDTIAGCTTHAIWEKKIYEQNELCTLMILLTEVLCPYEFKA